MPWTVEKSDRRAGFCRVALIAALLPGCGTATPDADPATTAKRSRSTREIRLIDLTEKEIDPLANSTGRGKVFLFVRPDCPISNRLAPEFAGLVRKFEPQGIGFFLVYPDAAIDAASIRKHLADFGYPCEGLRDPKHELVELTGATVTPEAVVFDANQEIVYRGRINDLYVDFGKARQAPTTHDLADALEAVVAGEPVALPVTKAVGCYIADLPRTAP
jgi:thiol-disulfide isomerase/thioredoxin